MVGIASLEELQHDHSVNSLWDTAAGLHMMNFLNPKHMGIPLPLPQADNQMQLVQRYSL